MSQKKTVLVHLDPGRGYSRDILRGIYAFNNQYTHWNILYQPAYFLKNKQEGASLRIIEHIRPDGCILEFTESLPLITDLNLPAVLISASGLHCNVPAVSGNYASEAEMAVKYFLSKGFRHMAFFGIRGLAWSDTRLNYFAGGVGKSKSSFFSYLLEGTDSDLLGNNFAPLFSWLKSLPKPVGIWCCNDDFGQILINSCLQAGIHVPHEVAVLGVDNDDLICNITVPNLSSIARNHHKIAFDICHHLTEMMAGKPTDPMTIPAEPLEICERASTDTLGYSDEMVVKAIQFISVNLNNAITVTDVAAHCRVSSKTLSHRFRTCTGVSVHGEIQFRKLNKFKKLLEAHMPVKQIAFELGFEDSSHVSRWFSNLEGVNPGEWKKRYL